ncbi:hypothetical protein [Rufibacter sp. LB8]|uniref:hypothetical protein n=1 Tax=Rufibacter sp. LB8 TaxID=2777781 RepID=UPI00178C32C5|nr:hypothetical protein [Rufibacter sp. LB8]
MRKTLFPCWAFLFLLACNGPSTETKTEAVRTNEPVGKTSTTNQSIKHVVQRSHAFSSSDAQDFFRLELRGDSITTSTVLFTITSSQGQLLHRQTFSAADLEASLVYEMTTPTATLPQREAYILRRMNEFVQPDRFVTPAITQSQNPDTSFVSLKDWQRLQAQPNTIGFKYTLGKEDGHLLVYDPTQKKAVRVGSFGG